MRSLLCLCHLLWLVFCCGGFYNVHKQWLNRPALRKSKGAGTSELPWLVTVAGTCQGISLGRWWILTTTSCLLKMKFPHLEVMGGPGPRSSFQGSQVCLHPSFNPQSWEGPAVAALGLLLLKEPTAMHRDKVWLSRTPGNLQRKCLHCKQRQCQVYQRQKTASDNLRHPGEEITMIPVRLLHSSACHRYGARVEEDKNLCIKSRDHHKSDCQMQPGSPLLCLFGSRWELVGLVDASPGSCYGPTLSIRTAPYSSWLRQHVKAATPLHCSPYPLMEPATPGDSTLNFSELASKFQPTHPWQFRNGNTDISQVTWLPRRSPPTPSAPPSPLPTDAPASSLLRPGGGLSFLPASHLPSGDSLPMVTNWAPLVTQTAGARSPFTGSTVVHSVLSTGQAAALWTPSGAQPVRSSVTFPSRSGEPWTSARPPVSIPALGLAPLASRAPGMAELSPPSATQIVAPPLAGWTPAKAPTMGTPLASTAKTPQYHFPKVWPAAHASYGFHADVQAPSSRPILPWTIRPGGTWPTEPGTSDVAFPQPPPSPFVTERSGVISRLLPSESPLYNMWTRGLAKPKAYSGDYFHVASSFPTAKPRTLGDLPAFPPPFSTPEPHSFPRLLQQVMKPTPQDAISYGSSFLREPGSSLKPLVLVTPRTRPLSPVHFPWVSEVGPAFYHHSPFSTPFSQNFQSDLSPLYQLQVKQKAGTTLAQCRLALAWEIKTKAFSLYQTAVPIKKSFECGMRPGFTHRCSGCSEADRGEFPWMASIQLTLYHFCAGSILNEWWILTTAKCASLIKNSEALAVAQVGVVNLQDHVQAQVVSIHHAIHHHSPQGPVGLGLILLQQPLHFQPLVLPICLEDSEKQEEHLKIADCYLPGWSLLRGGPVALQKRQLSMLRLSACSRFWPKLNEFTFCIEAKKVGMARCQGDLGAPLICKEKQKEVWVQVGVLSNFDEHCVKPYVFIRIAPYLSWLESVTQDDPHAPWGAQTDTSLLVSLPHPRTLVNRISVRFAMPWQALIVTCGSQICGGSLLNNSWVLTTADCVRNMKPENMAVFLGLNQHGSSLRAIRVANIFLHDDYFSNSPNNNLALVLLRGPIMSGQAFAPIKRRWTRNDGDECWFSGPRLLRPGEAEGYPKMFQVRILNDSSCSEFYQEPNTVLCVVPKRSNLPKAKVSSGGALLCRLGAANGSWAQTGLVGPSYFSTNIIPFLRWMELTAAEAGRPITFSKATSSTVFGSWVPGVPLFLPLLLGMVVGHVPPQLLFPP
nr:TPA_inf: Y-linked serine-like protease-like [Ornithorhynchus anatinus]